MDPAFYKKRIHAADQHADTPLFAPLPEIAPAPSAPGSRSSERGAKAADKIAKGQARTIMLTLAATSHLLSRDDLCDRTGISINAMCGRLDVLRKGGWIECVEDGATSRAGNAVDGFKLSSSGRAFLREKGAA